MDSAAVLTFLPRALALARDFDAALAIGTRETVQREGKRRVVRAGIVSVIVTLQAWALYATVPAEYLPAVLTLYVSALGQVLCWVVWTATAPASTAMHVLAAATSAVQTLREPAGTLLVDVYMHIVTARTVTRMFGGPGMDAAMAMRVTGAATQATGQAVFGTQASDAAWALVLGAEATDPTPLRLTAEECDGSDPITDVAFGPDEAVYVLDESRTAPVRLDTLRRMYSTGPRLYGGRNPFTNAPLRSVRKVRLEIGPEPVPEAAAPALTGQDIMRRELESRAQQLRQRP